MRNQLFAAARWASLPIDGCRGPVSDPGCRTERGGDLAEAVNRLVAVRDDWRAFRESLAT